MDKFKVIIVEDVKLELKGTEEIFKNEIEIDENILEIDRKIEEKQLIRVKNSQNLRRIAPNSKK